MFETSIQGGQQATAESIAKEFEVGVDDVQKITTHFIQQIKRGLESNCPYQIPAYVTKIPQGHEKGRFLAVDLGGTNCRVCAVDLRGNSTFDVFQQQHLVPADIRVNASYKPLFHFIATKIQDFLQEFAQKENDSSTRLDGRYNLGFTFSFTCEQTSIARGTLLHWDKGWDIPSALGQDPCALLQDAVNEIGLPVRVSVLANDAVGTLLARAYASQRRNSTLAAIILGTGTNAAYVENIANVQRLKPSVGHASESQDGGVMVINTEWGCWDDALQVLPQTLYDKLIDKASSDPGCGLLEKMVSGMYLGELMRLAILHLVQNGMFDMVVSEASCLHTQLGIQSAFLSQITSFESTDLQPIIPHVTNTLAASGVSSRDARAIQTLASAIVKRSARLVGAGLAAIIVQSGRLESHAVLSKTATSTHIDELREKPAKAWHSRLMSLLAHSARHIFGCIRPHRKLASISDDAPSYSKDTINSLIHVDDIIDIGVDGSLFEFYPGFESIMRSVLREIPEIGHTGEEKVRIQLTKDGSGTGAALIAAAAKDMKID